VVNLVDDTNRKRARLSRVLTHSPTHYYIILHEVSRTYNSVNRKTAVW